MSGEPIYGITHAIGHYAQAEMVPGPYRQVRLAARPKKHSVVLHHPGKKNVVPAADKSDRGGLPHPLNGQDAAFDYFLNFVVRRSQ